MISNCCGASLLKNSDICADCKEHCEPTPDFTWLDPSGELQDKFDSMMSTADRIITRGKQIKEMETK